MAGPGEPFGEDAFVARYLAPLTGGDPAAFGLRDDAALLEAREGHGLVMTCDTLVEDRHFLFDGTSESARAVAHKALAVNVSDLVAKGARPRAYLMSLVLPSADVDGWMPGFAGSLGECQRHWGLALIGGDTVVAPGKLSITITAIGEVGSGRMVTRSKAAAGDGIFVSGEIGDATLGLRLCKGECVGARWRQLLGDDGCELLVRRYRRPSPRIGLSDVLFNHASASIDVSDGLLRDLGRICGASGCGAEIDIGEVPLSQPARALVEAGEVGLADLLTGGDDYEIIACVAPADEAEFVGAVGAGIGVTQIGTIGQETGVRVVGVDGKPMAFSNVGWDHFR